MEIIFNLDIQNRLVTLKVTLSNAKISFETEAILSKSQLNDLLHSPNSGLAQKIIEKLLGTAPCPLHPIQDALLRLKLYKILCNHDRSLAGTHTIILNM